MADQQNEFKGTNEDLQEQQEVEVERDQKIDAPDMTPHLLPESKPIGRPKKTEHQKQREAIVASHAARLKALDENIAATEPGSVARRGYESDKSDFLFKSRKELAEFDETHKIAGRREYKWTSYAASEAVPRKHTVQDICIRVWLEIRYAQPGETRQIKNLLDMFVNLEKEVPEDLPPICREIWLEALRQVAIGHEAAKEKLGKGESVIDKMRDGVPIVPNAEQVSDVVNRPKREVQEAEDAKHLARGNFQSTAERTKSQLGINDPRSASYKPPKRGLQRS
jgi:hypothetical protein